MHSKYGKPISILSNSVSSTILDSQVWKHMIFIMGDIEPHIGLVVLVTLPFGGRTGLFQGTLLLMLWETFFMKLMLCLLIICSRDLGTPILFLLSFLILIPRIFYFSSCFCTCKDEYRWIMESFRKFLHSDCYPDFSGSFYHSRLLHVVG